MKINFGPRGTLQIDDARIIFRNFAGNATQFNREGDRNFAVVIDDQDIADALIKEGWNVRVKPPRDDEELPRMHLPVKIKFNDRGPVIYLKTGDAINKLDEESVDCLDHIDIAGVDMDIRPYDWEINGKTGRTAYLQAINIIQDVDRFATRYKTDSFGIDVDGDDTPF